MGLKTEICSLEYKLKTSKTRI